MGFETSGHSHLVGCPLKLSVQAAQATHEILTPVLLFTKFVIPFPRFYKFAESQIVLAFGLGVTMIWFNLKNVHIIS